MADVMRWRYGETSPVMVPVDADTVIDIGDLLYLDTDNARPAALQADEESEAANQELFHDRFLGVAMQRSAAGDTQPVRVATRGVFEFACPSDTHEVGDLLGAREAAGDTSLENQVITGVATPNLAIGRCAKRVVPADTRVLVEVVSTVAHGGPQAPA